MWISKRLPAVSLFSAFSCLCPPLAEAQQPAQNAISSPRFEVASVRLATEESRRSSGPRIQTAPGSLTTRGLTLRACILWAYQQPIQVIAPDWINGVALDIVAKASEPVGDEQLYLMLRTLLEERMGIKAHFEQRDTRVCDDDREGRSEVYQVHH